MASCLVPDFPAVMVALEHLKELDKQLKEDGVPFAPEASLHLTEITAAITELEAERRAAHELLEVETIENSKLRHQIHSIRERVSQEIAADVAAARASYAEEIEQLHKDLSTVSQLQENTAKRRDALLSHNEELQPEREQVMGKHRQVVAALDDRITLKYGLQIQLDQTRDQTEELKSCAAAVEQDKVTLQQRAELEREAFTVKQDKLSKDVEQVEGKIKHLKQVIKRCRRELDRVNDKKRETHDRLGELLIHMSRLESDLRRQRASRLQYEKQLEAETQKHQDLRQQREMMKKEMFDLQEAFSDAVQRLKEEIATVEGKIDEGRTSRLVYQDSLAQIYELFKRQRDEENEVRAEYLHVSQQLERSTQQLDERIASIVKYGKEIKEMDKQIEELLEADTINKRVFERNQEEMCGNVDTEKRNISLLEEEKSRLARLLEEQKREQEEHVAKTTSDISSTWEIYQELRREEAALLRRQPKSADAEMLTSYVTQCEAEYEQEETARHQEIERCTAEAEGVARSSEEKRREAEEKEEILKEVEAKWSKEKSRHESLETLTTEMERKRSGLERSIQLLKEKTVALLRPKEEMKADLEEMRKVYMDTLDGQASELRAAEMSIYDNGVKLDQVSMENSRLHLCIRQMTEAVSRAGEDKDRYWQEVQQFKQDIKASLEGLQEAWAEDLLVTRDCQSTDGVLLVATGDVLQRLKTRGQQLGSVRALLHRQMLDFSKRLGDKTAIEQQS